MSDDLYKWAKDLFPLNRSITGTDLIKTLKYIKNLLPQLKIKHIKSGTKVFDWIVPNEWHINAAYIKDQNNRDVVNIKKNNLHIVGYSYPINKTLTLEELQPHLFSLNNQPNAIPYVTSYYKKNWGFCISENKRKKLKKGKYKVFIDSKFKKGFLTYGEIKIKGRLKKEILLTTNICHPSMANNEISGIVVLISIVKKILKFKEKNYSYRIVFLPETIGSISYIYKNFFELKKYVFSGLVLSCIGDKGDFSYIPSRYGKTVSDKAVLYILENYTKKFKKYEYLDRGSDERQFCSPGIDLPICSIARSKYGTYPEYHTSLDNLKFISKKSLIESSNLIISIVKILDVNSYYKSKVICEPFLTKYNLYPALSSKNHICEDTQTILDVLAYADGKNDLIDICKIIKRDIFDVCEIIVRLKKLKLLS